MHAAWSRLAKCLQVLLNKGCDQVRLVSWPDSNCSMHAAWSRLAKCFQVLLNKGCDQVRLVSGIIASAADVQPGQGMPRDSKCFQTKAVRRRLLLGVTANAACMQPGQGLPGACKCF